MSSNYFGKIFRFTTWGESHGQAIGAVIDGCPSLIDLSEEDFTADMSRRKPGQSKFTTQRSENDNVKILSGVFDGKTTGTPISLIVWNSDAKSHDYSDIKEKFRPGHADYTYQEKYGIRDYRGGGRSSARETSMRVASGVIAKKIIPNIKIIAYVSKIGKIGLDMSDFDLSEINNNAFFCPSKKTAAMFEEYLVDARKNGFSLGAEITTIAQNVHTGLGEPMYYKLSSEIARGMMSINAVKGVEIGSGFGATSLNGIENADEMIIENDMPSFLSNHNGGILGGISSGQDIVVRVALKPTSSTILTQKTIDILGNETEISTKGRHDPCVGIRAVPVVESMLACTLADMTLINKTRRL